MERLTRQETIMVGGKEMAACNYKNDDCNDSCMYGNCRWQEKANMLLKEYEDTDLTPEQIKELKERDESKPPIYQVQGDERYEQEPEWWMCPCCDEVYDMDDDYDFCPKCGQRLLR